MTPEAIEHLRLVDEKLALIIDAVGACKLTPQKDRSPFEGLIRAVASQQLSTKAAATILGHIVPSRAQAYMTLAQQAADSRIYAGIHYAIDCTVGETVGQKVGNYAVTRAMSDGAEQ